MRSPPPRASRRRRRRSPRATRGAPRRPCAKRRARARRPSRGGATTGTAAAARILLGATRARREPKASKEAGKILAKATRGAAAGGIGVRAAAEACARVARATGLEVKTIVIPG